MKIGEPVRKVYRMPDVLPAPLPGQEQPVAEPKQAPAPIQEPIPTPVAPTPAAPTLVPA